MVPILSRKHTLPPARIAPALATSLFASMALAGPAAAADDTSPAGPAANATTLDELEVRGQSGLKPERSSNPRFTRPLQETPQTVQVITATLFNQQGATTLTEALRNSPGVGTFFAGENGNTATGDAIQMRGFDTSASLYLDGVRDLGSISRDMFNIEQIEVVKGPAGTDTGRSAPSGAINMISKEANLHDAAAATVSVGDAGQRRATADWNHRLGATSALRINAMWQDSDVAGRDHVNQKRWGLAPSLAFGLGSDSRAFLDLYYLRQDNIPDGLVPTIGLPGWQPQAGQESLAGHPVRPSNFYGTRQDHDAVTVEMGTLRLEHALSDQLLLSATTRWGRTTQDYLLAAFMSTGANTSSTDPSDLATYRLRRSTPTFKDQSNTILTQQLNLQAQFSTGPVGHTLSAGLEYAREEQANRAQAALAGSTWPAANLMHPDWDVTGLEWDYTGARTHGRTRTASLYAFDTVTLGGAFELTGGVRLDRYQTRFASTAIDGALTTLEDADSLFNWKLGALYKASGSINLYANMALSQQPPGGANFQLSTAANNANNPDMVPQRARTIEVGGKWSLASDALALNLALFQTDVSNEISGSAAEGWFQDGRKRVSGAELSAVGNITPDWSLSAGYTRQQARVLAGAAVTADGSYNLAYTPEEAFTGWTSYRLPMGLVLGGGVRYSGQMLRGTDGALGTPRAVKSYTVWDAVLTYPVSTWLSVRLNAYNLFDKRYVAAINKSGYRYTPGTPRTVLLTAEVRF
jgi:catecholate siderophore receptor